MNIPETNNSQVDDDTFIHVPWPTYAKIPIIFVTSLIPCLILVSIFSNNYKLMIFCIAYPFIAGPILYWMGRFPGTLESASEYSIFINPKSEKIVWLYALSAAERNDIPQSAYLKTSELKYSWNEDKLCLLFESGYLVLGKGDKMLPIREWLSRHGVCSGQFPR